MTSVDPATVAAGRHGHRRGRATPRGERRAAAGRGHGAVPTAVVVPAPCGYAAIDRGIGGGQPHVPRRRVGAGPGLERPRGGTMLHERSAYGPGRRRQRHWRRARALAQEAAGPRPVPACWSAARRCSSAPAWRSKRCASRPSAILSFRIATLARHCGARGVVDCAAADAARDRRAGRALPRGTRAVAELAAAERDGRRARRQSARRSRRRSSPSWSKRPSNAARRSKPAGASTSRSCGATA